MKKRRRGPNEPVTAEEMEQLCKKYHMESTFQKLSELTGINRDPVSLAELPPETVHIHSGKQPESGYMPEHVLPESGYMPEHEVTSYVSLTALRNNPLIAWRLVPSDLLGRLGQIITGEAFRVDWDKVRAALLQERITGNYRLVLMELFEEADRRRSFYLYFDFSGLHETMGLGYTVLQRARDSFRQPNPFVKGIDCVPGRGSFLQLADTFFVRGDRLD